MQKKFTLKVTGTKGGSLVRFGNFPPAFKFRSSDVGNSEQTQPNFRKKVLQPCNEDEADYSSLF